MTSNEVEKRFPIRAAWSLVLATLVSACVAPGDVTRAPTEVSSPTGQTPSGQTPSGPVRPVLPTGPFTLSGIVTLGTASGIAPLANAGVGGYIMMTDGNSHGLAPVVTDANGRYEFSNLPGGFVVLYPGAAHAYQPCAAIGTVGGANSVRDLELVDSAVTRPLTTADSPTLSGVVYRKTATGREPIAGAVIEYEYAPVIATTATTDAQGRYSLCQLPLGRGGLDVWLNGVQLGGAVVNVIGDDVLDFTF